MYHVILIIKNVLEGQHVLLKPTLAKVLHKMLINIINDDKKENKLLITFFICVL